MGWGEGVGWGGMVYRESGLSQLPGQSTGQWVGDVKDIPTVPSPRELESPNLALELAQDGSQPVQRLATELA